MLKKLQLQVLPELYGVVRLPAATHVPGWALQGRFCSITRTEDELSVVCRQQDIPADLTCAPNWRCLKVVGPLDFALVGIMANLSSALASRNISLFAISTYDTDYLMVRADMLPTAVAALTAEGHTVEK